MGKLHDVTAAPMTRTALEVAQIFRCHGSAYRKNHGLAPAQHQALRDIERCRTARLGGHLDACSRAAVIWPSPITPAATAIVPSARASSTPSGWRRAGSDFCPSPTSTWWSPCPTNSSPWPGATRHSCSISSLRAPPKLSSNLTSIGTMSVCRPSWASRQSCTPGIRTSTFTPI